MPLQHRDKEDIFWVTCPECRARIGIFLATEATVKSGETVMKIEVETPSLGEFIGLLESSGVDLSLVLVMDEGDRFIVSPKGYIGGSWRHINEAMREMGGEWISSGKRSRWEVMKEGLEE